jgi:hypothetical protein
MESRFLEIPVCLIHEDSRFPDRDERHIYEHLKYCLSHPSPYPLPAIRVRTFDKTIFVTEGHKYLRIARDFGRTWVRAILQITDGDLTDILKKFPHEIRLIANDELERELAAKVERAYHVYFFAEALSEDGQKRFLSDIAGFFERLDTPLINKSEKRLFNWAFPFGAHCAEFEALIPVGDKSWYQSYLQTCRRFNNEVARIVSFQGARFPG